MHVRASARRELTYVLLVPVPKRTNRRRRSARVWRFEIPIATDRQLCTKVWHGLVHNANEVSQQLL